MWFECTLAFTMLEPWEKILCGESIEDGEEVWLVLNVSFCSIGYHDPVLARWHGFRSLLPPACEKDV